MKEFLLQWYAKRKRPQGPSREGYGFFAGVVGLCCNVLLVLVKLATGLVTGSVAVIADAVNNLSDATSSLVTLVGFRLSEKPADEEHPFGHARIEQLAGAFIAVVMMLVGVELMKTSVGKILAPTPVSFSILSLLLLAAAVLVKGWMRSFYSFVAKRIDSATLTVAAQDSRNDIITTSVVLLGALLQFAFDWQVDGWLGALVALFIIVSGFLSLRDTLSPLLGEAPPKALVEGLSQDILAFEGVLGLHDLVVHTYGPTRRFATAHVEMSAEIDPRISHEVIDRIERELGQKYDVSLVVHYDPVDPPTEEALRLEAEIRDILQHMDPGFTLHDLRTVRSSADTKVIFDLVLPTGGKWTPEEAREQVSMAICELHPGYEPIIQVDQKYTVFSGGAERGSPSAKEKSIKKR